MLAAEYKPAVDFNDKRNMDLEAQVLFLSNLRLYPDSLLTP
mgnify:CR=1 FL=1